MILDSNLEFADAASVGTPNNTTVNVGDVIDLGTSGRDIGAGTPMYLVIQVTTSIGSGGAAVTRFLLSSDAGATLALNDTQTIHWESDEYTIAEMAAGFVVVVPLTSKGLGYERYLGFQIRETGSQALSSGNVNAFLTRDASQWTGYAQGDVAD